MALRGHVFNKQLFSSECFALFIDTFLNKNNGIITGCNLSNTANSISIESGYFCIKGRFLQEEGGTTFDIESTIQNDIYCKLICEIDLSQENTTSELKQASYKVLKSTTGYPSLQQEDITSVGQGNIYQFEFAQFKVTEQGIEDFVDKRTYLNFNSIYAEVRSMLSDLNTTAKSEIMELISDLKVFCDTAKEVLDENVAMNLLNLINQKSDVPRRKRITLFSSGWILNETTGKYEYRIDDITITEDDDIDVRIEDEEKENILADAEVRLYTYNGYYAFKAKELVEVDIEAELVITRTKLDTGEVQSNAM